MDIFFSVVVPCYNVAETILPTLKCLNDQTFTDFEVIFVNDGSSDSTQFILESFESSFQVKIISKSNAGLGAARNTGIKASNAKYIAFLDADDIWTSDKLMISYQHLVDSCSDCFCHDELVVDEHNRLLRRNYYGPYTTFEDLYFKGNCLSPSAVIVRRDIFDKVGLFTEDLRLHGVEDYDMWMRLAMNKTKISYLRNFLGKYVIHGGNMSSSAEFFEKEERLLVIYSKYFPLGPKNLVRLKMRFLMFYTLKLVKLKLKIIVVSDFLSNIFLIILSLERFLAKMERKHEIYNY